MPFKDFDAEVREQEREPIEFKLAGTHFTCMEPFPIGSVVLFARTFTKAKDLDQVAALDTLIRSWINPEQWDQWDAALGTVSDLAILNSVVEYIIEEVTGRPTAAPSS